jgi:hypothetical protein
VSTISDPKKKWAIVFCALEGSSPDPSVLDELARMFRLSAAGHAFPRPTLPYLFSVADFWHDQSLGVIDVSDSPVFGWYPCEWTMLGAPGLTAYPGIDGNWPDPDNNSRRVFAAQAREILKAALARLGRRAGPPFRLGDFRGVLSVWNFPVSGGQTGTDVVYGLNGTAGPLSWSDGNWHRCWLCSSLVRLGLSTLGSSCAVGGSHDPNMNTQYLVPTVAVTQGSRELRVCAKCGTLYSGRASNVCPAGAGHVPGLTSLYWMMSDWAAPIGDPGWSECSACGMVVADAGAGCPGTGAAHAVPKERPLSIPFVESGLDRDFFCHEMGHAYGFVHGRSTQPQSMDLDNDCNPGAYGDRFDIMSYRDVDSYNPSPGDPDAAWGPRGPGLALQQIVNSGLVSQGTIRDVGAEERRAVATLRAVGSSDPGFAALRADSLVAEFRRVDGWDRGLKVDGQAAVIVHQTDLPTPVVLLSTQGHPYVGPSDEIETPNVGGEGGLRLRVRSMNATSAEVEVMRTDAFSYRWQRWLILPCAYRSLPRTRGGAPDVPIGYQALADLLHSGPGDVESFWNDMSHGAVQFAGGSTVSGRGNIELQWIPLSYSAATDAKRSAEERVGAAVTAALALKNPTRIKSPLYLDWRFFTGIIIARNQEIGDGYLGLLQLPTGNTLRHDIDCTKETKTGDAAGPRLFQVIELSVSALTHAGISRAIGESLGLPSEPEDRFTVMSERGDRFWFRDPQRPEWGATGPSLSTDALKSLGWLRDWEVFVPEIPSGQRSTRGNLRLLPLNARGVKMPFQRVSTPSYVRLEVGPYGFECRTRERWDAGFPPELQAVVLARELEPSGPVKPIALTQGQSIAWGSPLRRILGGGEVKVTSLSSSGAVLEYLIDEGATEIEAGGGTLRGGGTVLFTPDGRIIRIAPGDPYERAVAAAVRELEELAERISNERGMGG